MCGGILVEVVCFLIFLLFIGFLAKMVCRYR